MKVTRFNLFFILVLGWVYGASGQIPYGNPGDQTAVYKDNTTAPFGYYEYLPLDYVHDGDKKYSLLIFFHGSSGAGNGNNELSDVLKHGVPSLINRGKDFDAIVISPQSPTYEFEGDDSKLMYDYIMQHYPIDSTRVYLTGLSSGGSSTWRALDIFGDKIAAALPICGRTRVSEPSENLLQTAIWVHHNFNDPTINYRETVDNLDRITNTGISVMDSYPYLEDEIEPELDYTMSYDQTSRTWIGADQATTPTTTLGFTLYKEGGHNAWTQVYNNTIVWDWLFSQFIETYTEEEEEEEEEEEDNNENEDDSEDEEETDDDNQEEEEEETDEEEVAEQIEKEIDTEFSYYPNPSKGVIYLNNISTANSWIHIIEYSGKRLAKIPVDNKETQLVDLTPYGSGLYFLRIISSTESTKEQVFKIIIK
ncbi:T9SS type A sorting domain-containing protein [Aquimarina sp. W85]|uniref:T9SS type A sorting domain-containing protein n=1 Tax=Aquimarina rhodophyticola TaxID=3342246 RepID=UPI00366DBAD6